ncbi:MAG TPA: pyrroline-5-carboxylate reductase [Chloroflexi bacterium]|nr:pyrroline-5-carboxylate reductase [Chloroflexota bacterium]
MAVSLPNTTIAFIGPGTMAEAMITGLLREGVASPERIVAAGPRQQRLERLETRYGIRTTRENATAAAEADVVVLSVKPQVLSKVLPELKGRIRPEALVLSIVAGATMERLSHGLQHPAVVRAMPNTPAQIGMGITVWTAAQAVSPTQRETARGVLTALGDEIFMEDEVYLDMATALSGTGPAYVFLFMEALIDAGVHLGFPRRVAEQLVVQTVKGSAAYYERQQGEVHLAHLRNQVTSPGGTSASALYYLEKAGFRTAISRAVWAAYERALSLAQNGKPQPPK